LPPRGEQLALLALAVAAISISFAAPLVRLAKVDGIVAAWWRMLVGAAATLAAAAARNRLPWRGETLLPAMMGGVLLALHFSLWFKSLQYSSIASSTGIVVTYPAIAAAVEAAIGETGHRDLLATALGVLGVALLSTPWAGASLKGSILALTAAFAAALYFLLGRRLRARGVSTLEYTLVVYSAALLSLSLYAAAMGTNPLHVPGDSLPYLLLLGIVPMLGGHTAMNYALGYMPASRVAMVALVEPFGASLLGWLLLGEEPPPAALPGLLLAALSVRLTIGSEKVL